MSSFTDVLKLEQPVDGDGSWGDAYREMVGILDRISAPDLTLYVSSVFTTGNVFPTQTPGTDRIHFSTIQDAIDAADARGWTDDDLGAVILITPGQYQENITIPGSLHLAAWAPAGAYFGAGRVTISGNAATLATTINIEPKDGQFARVSLSGITVENSYNQDRTGLADIDGNTPYAINFKRPPTPTYGSQQSWFRMNDCHVRMQTWGIENRWDCGIRIRGWVTFSIRRSQVAAIGFGGGDPDPAWVRKLLRVEGDFISAGVSAAGLIRDSSFDQGSDIDTGDYPIINASDGVFVQACFSAWNLTTASPSFTKGIGSVTLQGIESSGEVATNRNIEGRSCLVM